MCDSNKYTPTTAEKKVLAALSNPENYLITVTELCKKADVGRNTYYTMLKKEGFVKARSEILDKVFDSLVPDVKKAAVKYALNNAKNFQDRKMILEMSGEYKPALEQNTNLNIKSPYNDITTAELKKIADKLDDEDE